MNTLNTVRSIIFLTFSLSGSNALACELADLDPYGVAAPQAEPQFAAFKNNTPQKLKLAKKQ